MIWYELNPTDTLFFRGAEPLEAGQPSGNVLFPPPVSVISGAIRTAVLRQQGISFSDYKAGKCPENLRQKIGDCGLPAPFQVSAVLIRHGKGTYAPCPASWFVDKKEKVEGEADFSPTGCTLLKAGPSAPEAAVLILATSAGTNLPLVRGAADAKSLAGYWTRLECLRNPPKTFAEGDILRSADLYDLEIRTGIAIDQNRRVRDAQIYTAAHLRLRPDVSLLVALDKDPGLQERGILPLGGEQRVCGYARAANVPKLPDKAASQYLALAPVELTRDTSAAVFAAGKTVTLAGWDMAKGFHKPTIAWLPAGTVFTQKIHSSCIPF